MKVFRRREGDQRTLASASDIVLAARSVFEAREFASVGPEEIATAAHASIDDVYRHFASLGELYLAVFQQVTTEVVERIGDRLVSDDPMTLMREGIDAYLDVYSQPQYRRVLLVDAPLAIGYDRWREESDAYGSRLVDAALADAMDKGVLRDQPVRPLANVVIGMLEAAAHFTAAQPDRSVAIGQARRVLNDVLDGLVVAERSPAGRSGAESPSIPPARGPS